MSRVCGSTDPNTSVPIIASVPTTKSQTSMGNSVSNPMNDTTHWENPDTPIPVPLASRNVLEVHPNVPTGAPAQTKVWYKESDIAVTDDLESTRNSTEWSPIHPFRNQCLAPYICRTSSSTWSSPTGFGPVCVASTCPSSLWSDIAELSVVRTTEVLVSPAVSWSPNHTASSPTESVVWGVVDWDKSEHDVCPDESVDEDELRSWWMAFRTVWVRSQSKWRFPVMN